MLLVRFVKNVSLALVFSGLVACGGGGGSDGGGSNGGNNPPANKAPTVNAGTDQTVDEQTPVTLAGTASDSDGTIASYSWTQTAGTSVTLSDANTASVSFSAPAVDTDTTLTFELTVKDNDGATGSQSVNIVIGDLPESITGKVYLTDVVTDAIVRLLSEDENIEIDSTITDQFGNFTLQVSEQDIAANNNLIIEAILPDSEIAIRSAVKAQSVQDQIYSSPLTNISIYTEAAKIIAESETSIDVTTFIEEILNYSDELQLPMSTKNNGVNQLAEKIQSYADSPSLVEQTEFKKDLLLTLIEAKWPNTLQSNSDYSIGFNVSSLLENIIIEVSNAENIQNSEITDNKLVFSTGAPSAAKITLDLLYNSELEKRTDLNAMVVTAGEPVTLLVPIGETVTLNNGNLTVQTTQDSFSSTTNLNISLVVQLPTEYGEELENVFTISAGVQPENAVTLKWQVQSDADATNTRLMYIDPATQETEVFLPVSYESETKQLLFEISHFSTYGIFKSESPYSLATQFTMQMVEADPKGVFRFIRDDVLDQLDKEAAFERLNKSCSFNHRNESEVCASYLERLSSKALNSFMQLATDISNLEKLNELTFRYTLFQLFASNALEEYVKLQGRVKSLAYILANGSQYSVRLPSIFHNSLDNGVESIYKFSGGDFYYIPMSAKRIAMVGATSPEQTLGDWKQKIENSSIYRDEKLAGCEAGMHLVEALRKAELTTVPFVPSSPHKEVLSQRTAFAEQWALLMHEDFTGMLKAEVGVGIESSSDDFIIPAVSQMLVELTPAKPLLESIGAYLALTKPVKNAHDLATEQLSSYLRANEFQDAKTTVTGSCSSYHCLGATEKGNWVEYNYQGVASFIPRESYFLMSSLDTWKQTFSQCDFADSEYDGPSDTGVDDSKNNDTGGYQDNGDTPVQVVVNADLQVSGNLEVGSSISFNAINSTTTAGELSYQWQVFKPSGSNASLNSSTAQQVSLLPDKYGSYTILLTVAANGITAQTQYVFTVKEQGNTKIENSGPQYVFGSANSGRAGNQGQQWEWTFNVDQDATEIVVWRVGGSSSDDGLGIALRNGNKPTIKCGGASNNICHFDKADYEGDVKGKRETIFVENPKPGNYHLMAYAFADFNKNSIYFEVKKDLDKDNDGVPNSQDWAPNDKNEAYDSDNDGVGDNADAFPNDISASVDNDNDGQPDSWNSGYNAQSSATGLTLDTALGVTSFVQNAGYVSVAGQIYILPYGSSTAQFTLLNQAAHGAVVMQEGKWLYTPEAGFTGTDSFTYSTNDNGNVTQITVQLNVDDEYTPPEPVYEQYAGFAISTTTSAYGAYHNTICATDFGNDWHIAEWNEVKAYYNNGGSLATLVEKLGLETRNNAWLTRDGNISYDSTRDYFVSYHNHNKPSNYLAHDNLDNYFLSLGSWTGTLPVMCSNITGNGGGEEPGTFDGNWTITITPTTQDEDCGYPQSGKAAFAVTYGELSANVSTPNSTYGVIGSIDSDGLMSGEFTDHRGTFGTLQGQFSASSANGTAQWENHTCDFVWTATKNSPTSGLVAYFPFDGDANDASGNGNHGQTNGQISYKNGLNGFSINFDNGPTSDLFYTNQWISGLTPLSFSELTVSLWVNFDASATEHSASLFSIGTQTNESGNNGINIAVLNDGELRAAAINGTNGYGLGGHTPVHLGTDKWRHVVIVLSRNKFQMFLDGILADEINITSSLSFSNLKWFFALSEWYKSTARSSRFDGRLDEVRIYNRALAESEIEALYQKDKPTNNNPLTVATGKLNDTGITVSQAAGDDAQYGRDALAAAGQLTKIGGGNAGFDYTKLDANGSDLPESATQWSCVRDNHTGLIWEVKTDDGGLRDKDNTYTWYNPDSATNGGSAGTENGGSCPDIGNCDTQKYVSRMNELKLCGLSHWEIPKYFELSSIVDFSASSPSVDVNYFPNTKSNWFWSSSNLAFKFSYNMRVVNFDEGNYYKESMGHKSRAGFIRLMSRLN